MKKWLSFWMNILDLKKEYFFWKNIMDLFLNWINFSQFNENSKFNGYSKQLGLTRLEQAIPEWTRKDYFRPTNIRTNWISATRPDQISQTRPDQIRSARPDQTRLWYRQITRKGPSSLLHRSHGVLFYCLLNTSY